MIKIVIEDADIGRSSTTTRVEFIVQHPSNGAILAYCDTKEEAVAVREGINDLARQLRGIGHKVA